MNPDPLLSGKLYATDHITVSYDAQRCRHVAECVRGLPQVFDPQRRPWIMAQLAGPEQLAEVVRRCPTGALHYTLASGEPEAPATPTTIAPQPDGPLLIRGDLRIQTPEGERPEVRAALCRCGASGNKPYCDGSHARIGWHSGEEPSASS
ncbi:(4Fe-4S)-binding protein [Deinococcus sonorensis]|uniref:(4Fe-4S)-binding protein n=2 Tax=Deinococcus sonorensis TaxID=309891 RepID=A0AAU7UEM2_9DEIO